MSGHPDVAEMRERYANVVVGRQAVALDGLVLLTGLYAAISPWVVHFRVTNPDLAINNLIIGLGLAAIGMGLSVAGDRMFRLSWACTLIGVWMIISPWVVTPGHRPDAGMIWNNVLIGALACLGGLAATGLVMGSTGGGGMRRAAR